MIPYDPPPSRPPEPPDPDTRSRRYLAVAVLLGFLLVALSASPVLAHGGDGRRADCPISGSRTASWGEGTAHTYSIGQTRYAEAWFCDRYNDGHCVTAIAVNAWSRFVVGRDCSLGGAVHRVLRLNLSAPFTRVYITNGHNYLTLCGPGSGRSC